MTWIAYPTMNKADYRGRRRTRNKTQAHHFRDSIMRLHHEGKTDSDIAAITGLTRAAIATEREALGLAISKSGGVEFSPTEDNQILNLRDGKGFRWTEIAKILRTGKIGAQVQVRYNYLDSMRVRRNKNGEKKIRFCHNPACCQEFMSTGNNNWYCDTCRASEDREVDYYVVSHAYGPGLD